MTDLEFYQACVLAILSSGSHPTTAHQGAETSLELYLSLKEELERE